MVKARSIRESEIDEVLDLWKSVWPEDHPGYFDRFFFGDTEFLPEYTRVIEQDDHIVSVAQIVKRVLSGPGYELNLGGFANVATLPEYRGKGYGRACVQNAMEVAKSDAMDICLLFTGSPMFYETLGFERLPAPMTSISVFPLPSRAPSAGSCTSEASSRASSPSTG